MLYSSLDALLKLSKTTSPNKRFDNVCMIECTAGCGDFFGVKILLHRAFVSPLAGTQIS